MHRRKLALTDILLKKLPEIRCRVDAIYGEQDALYVGKLEHLEELLKTAPRFGELVRVPEAGHWVQYEAGAAFDGELMRVLASPA
jgi:2-hydroxy-6-oxonona-2,4-dienedioate hydrolase